MSTITARRWYRILGPWPLRPFVVLFFAWYFYIATATGQLIGQQNIDPSDWLRGAVVLSAPAAIVMAIVIHLGRLWQIHHGIRGLPYFATLLSAAASGLGVRFLIGAIPADTLSAPVPILVGVMRTTVLLIITLAIAGSLTDRLQRQVDATSDALLLLREQQKLMLEADEAARRQVAALLHDRVQAGLIAAGLELQMMAGRVGAEERQQLQQLVARLEDLRSLDVRRAARALSPDLHDVDLQTALEELASQYEPGMGATVIVSAEVDSRHTEIGDEVVLAVYRIVEQALLNSATHGQAQHARVEVDIAGDAVLITVNDDGRGMKEPHGQGLGSAVLTTWTRLFDGEWCLQQGVGGGAELRARLTILSHC